MLLSGPSGLKGSQFLGFVLEVNSLCCKQWNLVLLPRRGAEKGYWRDPNAWTWGSLDSSPRPITRSPISSAATMTDRTKDITKPHCYSIWWARSSSSWGRCCLVPPLSFLFPFTRHYVSVPPGQSVTWLLERVLFITHQGDPGSHLTRIDYSSSLLSQCHLHPFLFSKFWMILP